MSSGQRLLSTEGLLDTVAVAKTGNGSFKVQLTGLGQVGSLAVVVELEESRATLNLILHNGRRAHFAELQLAIGLVKGKFEVAPELHGHRVLFTA